MKKRLDHLLHRYLLPYGGLLLIRALSATYRYEVLNRLNPHSERLLSNRYVYGSWHQRLFAGVAFFSAYAPIAIMISRSRDGEFIARIAGMLGWQPVRGSSTRGGTAALRQLKRLAAKDYKIAHIVDGPKGPPGVIKPGLIFLAQVLGTPIVPVILSPQKKWVFNSWDRFMVPKPFSRVIIRLGAPIEVPTRMDAQAFESLRRHVENRMKQLYADTDRIWSAPAESSITANPQGR